MGVNVSIYGLSTEGYSLASALVLNGANVSIIDELQRTAFNLRSEVARTYPDVNSLIEDELLLGIEPEEVAIQNSDYIFFTPKIRKIGQEAMDDIKSKFRDVVSNIKKGSSIIFNIPLGFGMNRENIDMLEHITGFDENEINYHYMPIGSLDYNISIIGSINKDKKLLKLLSNMLDSNIQLLDLESAEIVNISKILSYYTSLISTFETYKHANKPIDREELRELYIDDIASGLFDLRMILLSLTTSNPLSYVINGSIKSVDGYVKYLIDRLKKSIKALELKASRVKIRLVWNLDRYEIRGDKLHMLELLEKRLRDHITDVESITNASKSYINIVDDKSIILIICSRNAYDNINISKSMDNIILLKSNPFCELVKNEG
ncbi:MAG: hypothetical protein KatS3mg003_2063 [Candidatus Nitrosocaldaceae archaeon]|nr:MAG: hypothetical protein KatS3mg003_2063 [Candidatus Nitrosocaldaceae archaeon]